MYVTLCFVSFSTVMDEKKRALINRNMVQIKAYGILCLDIKNS